VEYLFLCINKLTYAYNVSNRRVAMRFYVIKLPKFISKIVAFLVSLFSKKEKEDKKAK